MTEQRLALGAWGEEQAVTFLQRQGMKILERNFRTPAGEIDIVARDRSYLVFVEVKTRRSARFGTPQEAVGVRKQRQILRTAQWYMQRKPTRLQPRFDVVAILCQSGDSPQVTHLADAFSLD